MSTARIRFTAEDRREQILSVATDLFARQGFNGTTTRHIAEAAEVNEALIFRHFPTKEELYWAVLERKCKALVWEESLDKRLSSGKGDREVFQSIASDILDRRRKDPTLGRLLLFSALENHELSDRFFRTNFASYYDKLADYIRQRIREGAFRKVDPMLAARGFLGMINYHFQIQELFGGKKYHKYEDADVTATLTDLWLHGMVNSKNGNGSHKNQAGK